MWIYAHRFLKSLCWSVMNEKYKKKKIAQKWSSLQSGKRTIRHQTENAGLWYSSSHPTESNLPQVWLYIYLSPHTRGLWGCILFKFRQQLGCHVLHFILVAKCYIHASIGECAHQCGSSWSAGPGCFLLMKTSHPRTSLYAQTPSVPGTAGIFTLGWA